MERLLKEEEEEEEDDDEIPASPMEANAWVVWHLCWRFSFT